MKTQQLKFKRGLILYMCMHNSKSDAWYEHLITTVNVWPCEHYKRNLLYCALSAYLPRSRNYQTLFHMDNQSVVALQKE